MGKAFSGFVQEDFSAFAEAKQEDARFNKERKVVWHKMKALQVSLDNELKRRGFALKGHKPSQYWINSTKKRVNGIWIAYTDIDPYYMGCQLNFGIYRQAAFCGIEINEKAHEHLNRVSEFISNNQLEFLSIIEVLDTRHFHIGYNNWEIDSKKLSALDINDLLVSLVKESGWFDLGESYSRNENLVASISVVSKIADIFELLFPLYLSFVGKRPIGQTKADKLLRISDTKERDVIRREKELAPELVTLSREQMDEVIKAIDERNKAESGYRDTRQLQTYRRNPVLSAMLKERCKDICQICGTTIDVEKGYFCDTHHLKPLKAGGLDVSENIVVVCPNHHRVLDRSDIEIISSDPLKLMVKSSRQILEVKA